MTKLLVIDDEPGICFSIGQVLETDAIEVLSAQSAEEGLRLAAREAPDVILLDIHLGEFSGFDVFRDLQAIDPKRPVIFITGGSTAEANTEAKKLGAYEFLIKPLDVTQIRKVVERAVARSRAIRSLGREGERCE